MSCTMHVKCLPSAWLTFVSSVRIRKILVEYIIQVLVDFRFLSSRFDSVVDDTLVQLAGCRGFESHLCSSLTVSLDSHTPMDVRLKQWSHTGSSGTIMRAQRAESSTPVIAALASVERERKQWETTSEAIFFQA